MGMSIDEHKAQLKKLKAFHNGSYGASINFALDTMRKYQKIEQIYQKWNEVNDFSYNQAMREIGEVMEDKSEESNGGTYSKNILQGCKRAY